MQWDTPARTRQYCVDTISQVHGGCLHHLQMSNVLELNTKSLSQFYYKRLLLFTQVISHSNQYSSTAENKSSSKLLNHPSWRSVSVRVYPWSSHRTLPETAYGFTRGRRIALFRKLRQKCQIWITHSSPFFFFRGFWGLPRRHCNVRCLITHSTLCVTDLGCVGWSWTGLPKLRWLLNSGLLWRTDPVFTPGGIHTRPVFALGHYSCRFGVISLSESAQDRMHNSAARTQWTYMYKRGVLLVVYMVNDNSYTQTHVLIVTR